MHGRETGRVPVSSLQRVVDGPSRLPIEGRCPEKGQPHPPPVPDEGIAGRVTEQKSSSVQSFMTWKDVMNKSKMQKRQNRIKLVLAILLVVMLAAGLSIGIFMGVRGNQSARDLFEEGQQAFTEGRYEDAAELYLRGLKKQPDSSIGYNLLGMTYRFQCNQTGSAALKQMETDAFRKAVDLNPNEPTSLVNLGMTLFGTGKRKEGAAFLKKALEAYPNHPDRANIEEMIRQAEAPQ